MTKIARLNKTYITKKKIETTALENINLELNNTGLVFITGRTGCGKSTLLNILGRLDEETSGSIIIDEEDITKFNKKEIENYRNNHIGFIFQEYNLIDEFTVYENIALVYKLKKEKVNEEEIKELLEKFGLTEKINKRGDELSGGERQRVTIIRAIVKKPKLILADEPTGALDEITGKEIIEALKEISKETLVIVVTHDEEYPEKYGDRIIELEDGKIIKDIIKTKLEEKNETKEIKKYNSKLSFKEILKLSLSTIKKRIFRLTLMSIIMASALIIIGTLSTYANYNKEKMIYESTIKGGDNHILVGHKLGLGPNNVQTLLNDVDKEYLEKKYGQKFYPYYKVLTIMFYENFFKCNGNPSINFYKVSSSGSMEINEEIAKDLKLKLYAGRFPTSDNEVVITDYQFILFRDFGYCENKDEENSKTEIKKYNDIINKTICNGEFKIVGVLNTNFDEERYEVLKQYNTGIIEGDMGIVNLNFEMEILVEETLSSCVFYNYGYISKYLEEKDLLNFRRYLTYQPRLYLNQPYDYNNTLVNIYSIAKIDICKEEIIYKEGYNKSTLADDEMIINWESLNSVGYEYKIDGEPLKNIVNKKVDEYMKTDAANILKKQAIEETGYPYDATFDEYYELFKWKVENVILKELFNEKLFEDLETVTLYAKTWNDEFIMERQMKIVGFYNLNSFTEKEYNHEDIARVQIYFSSNFFDEYVDASESNYYRGFFTSLDSKDLKLLKDLTDNNKSYLEEKYSANNQYVIQARRANNYLRKTSKLGFKIEIVLIIFSILLFITYIDFIVKDRKQEIGVLISLGTRKKDISKIFMLVSLIISLAVSIISIIGSIILTKIINNQIRKICCVILEILTFDILSVLVILFLSIVMTMIITKITINNLTRKKPIDIMKTERE